MDDIDADAIEGRSENLSTEGICVGYASASAAPSTLDTSFLDILSCRHDLMTELAWCTFPTTGPCHPWLYRRHDIVIPNQFGVMKRAVRKAVTLWCGLCLLSRSSNNLDSASSNGPKKYGWKRQKR